MKIYAYQYDKLKEINKFFKETDKINNSDYRIMELEHSKSKKGQIKFTNKLHKVTRNRLLKKFLIIVAGVILLFVAGNLIFENIKVSGIFEVFIEGAIIGALILPVVWFYKLLTLSKSIIFERNEVYSPMLISSNFIAKFDEIKLKSNENFNYALFFHKNKPVNKCIILLADNDKKNKEMMEFVNGYASKTGKKITNEI